MARPAPRRARAHWDVERRNQVLLVALVVAVVVAALGIALFGYYQTHVAPKGKTVLQIGDRSFSLGYFERRARFEVRSGNTAILSDASQAANFLMVIVQREELIRLGAAEKGVAVTDKDIDDDIRTRGGVSPDADHNVFASAYRTAVQDSGLTTSDYRDFIAAGILEARLRQQFAGEAPAKAEQARYRVIRVATPEEAQAVLDRLNGGEDFAAVAAEVSTDASSKDNGGEKPWAARGELEDALDQAIFALQPGQRSGAVQTQNGAVVIEVLERQPDRDISPEQRIALGDRAFGKWLADLRERTRTVTYQNQDQVNAILEALASEAGKRA